jgi:hypothetical protein
MRSREFTINVPITINFSDDGEPTVDTVDIPAPDELDQNPVMVPPLQQHMELQKAEQGKASPVIDKLTQAQPDHGAQPPEERPGLDDEFIQRLRALILR